MATQILNHAIFIALAPLKAIRGNIRNNRLKRERERERAQEQRDFSALLADTSHIRAVEKTEERMCYDSTWVITLLADSEEHKVKIVRRSWEERLSLLYLLANTKTAEAIKALDERDNIYYD